jgi:hypothetical protein
MVAALNDDHGRVSYSSMKAQRISLPLAAWIENKYIVTWSSGADLLPAGDGAGSQVESLHVLILVRVHSRHSSFN